MYAVAQWLRDLRPIRYLIVVCGRCGRLAFLRAPLLGCEECPGYPAPPPTENGPGAPQNH